MFVFDKSMSMPSVWVWAPTMPLARGPAVMIVLSRTSILTRPSFVAGLVALSLLARIPLTASPVLVVPDVSMQLPHDVDGDVTLTMMYLIDARFCSPVAESLTPSTLTLRSVVESASSSLVIGACVVRVESLH